MVRDAGFKSCQANINLRVIRADDAKIIAVASAYDRAAHIDEISGGTQALQKAAKTAAIELKDKIVNVWQEDVYSTGSTFANKEITGVLAEVLWSIFQAASKGRWHLFLAAIQKFTPSYSFLSG